MSYGIFLYRFCSRNRYLFMNTFRKGSILFIVVVAIGAGLYVQRVQMLEWYRVVSKPALPVPIEYQEMLIQEQKERKEKETVEDLIPQEHEEVTEDKENITP